MSTTPGLASKGEKGKVKFSSLNINNLYKDTLGQSFEKQQQKNTLSHKHGMQSLGKVPTARRPPANLPSLKSEHSGTDTAVSLVPSNGPGWGKQENSTTPVTTTTSTSSTTSSTTSTTTSQLTAHQAAIALPVTTTIPPPNKVHPTPAVPVTGDKSWSAVMTGTDLTAHPPPYQSPQFQHEFPSLSAGDGVPVRSGTDTQYGPGPSLRPQTEGSWIQGGSRGPPEGGPRTSSVPLGAPPQLSAQVGQPLTQHQYRTFVPPFMYRGNTNFPANGHTTPPIAAQAPLIPPANAGGRRPGEHRGSKPSEIEDLSHRPIIKEEELSGMDNLTGDMGWAIHDDIDYNQKLAFSDDESKPDKEQRKMSTRILRDEKSDNYPQETSAHKTWSNRNIPAAASQPIGGQRQDDEEVQAQRRRQQQEVASAIERAKQRKEEEEKKFLESKQNAAKKLQKLNEKSCKNKRDKESDETIGTINPASVPPQAIAPVPILLPGWERDRDRDVRSKPENEEKPKASNRDGGQSDFRQLTQIEGRNFSRKDSRGPDKEQNATPSFSRQFQNNLPPRFQKQQHLNASSTSQQPMSFPYENNRWMQSGTNKTSPNNRKNRPESEDKDREDDRFRRHGPDDNFRSSSHRTYSESGRKSSADNRYDDYRQDYDLKKEKLEDEKRNERNRDRHDNKSGSFDNLTISRQNSDEWHNERRIDRYDRPQRPDSRDSRASRESRDSARHSEPREYIPWQESNFEDTYEEKKKEYRMQVPGPITKEKIEADDLRSEKRNLTQLKRGSVPEKKQADKREEKSAEKESEDVWNVNRSKDINDGPRAWADAISPNTVAPENPKFMEMQKSNENLKNIEEEDEEKKEKFVEKERDDKRNHGSNRGRSDSQGSRNQGWGGGGSGGVVYRTWSKKGASGRGSRGGPRSASGKGGDWHGTESEGSADDNSNSVDNVSQRSPKPTKKFDKEEKDKIKDTKTEKSLPIERKSEKSHRDFVPRGEPSRHGRGGGSGFRGGRGGCKRIDGYGPPPVKSPFSHTEEQGQKKEMDSLDNISTFEDKSKTAAPLKDSIGGERKLDDRAKAKKSDNRRGKPRGEGELSDNSDDASKDKSRKSSKGPPRQSSQSNMQRRGGNSVAPPRLVSEKRSFGGPNRNDPPNRQNSSGSLRSTQSKDNKDKDNVTASSDNKTKDEVEVNDPEVEGSPQSDSDGFQEVKSKKTGKIDRPNKLDEKPKAQVVKSEKDTKNERNERKSKPTTQLSQQQIANIPSLMATPVNPPANMPQPQNKFERPRQNKLPPRLVKQRENSRLHKAQMQQGMCEVNDMNKVNQNIYGMKDGTGVVSNTIGNAWEKPLTTQLRGNLEQDNMLSVGMESCKSLDQSQVHCQNPTSNTEDKTVLDGSKPLNTIIFENTNFKSAPGCRSRNDKQRPPKIEDGIDSNPVLTTFNKPIGELINKNDKPDIQIQLTFNKEDTADMKLDFFETEISHLTEDKTSKNIGLPRTIHNMTSSNSTISPSTADALNIKIQSVKKVWENMSTVIEHSTVGQDDAASFSTSFDPNSLDPSGAFSKGTDTPDDNHEVYSPSPNNQNASNSTTNVCKVKPTQQVAGSTGQTVLSTGTHQQHSAMVGAPGLMGHPLSPPPMQPVIGGGVGLGQPPQQYTASQHISYQASLGGSTQYGMPAIPSPPNVLYNSTQQLQAQTAGLYGAFQIDQSQVINNQGRSQYSQYSYGLGQTASSPYSQSMYGAVMQTAQPHAPPTAQAPPDLYTNMSNYRLPAGGPFGQNQQLNNPTTVLISSTSNSLMSATVKPSNQQISAIGTKAGGVGQAYQQQSQQGQQLYMAYEPALQANYLQNTGVMQRGPGGPVQNNVVPGLQPSALQPSSSYYSGSTGGQAGYFQQPGSSTLQSAQMPQHQAGYGLQGNVFGTHNQSHASAGMQNYGSPFLSGPIQLAAAMSAQQFRSATLPNAYMKGVGSQQITDQTGRSQQLKSPGSQQEVLSSVFNTGSQIPSPKSRQTCKQPPPQQSPTSQHKYLYQSVSSQQQQGRYPAPIQRPVVNYQPTLGSVQNNGSQKHRNSNNPNNRTTPRQFYGGQGGNLNSQSDKTEDSKLNDNVVNVANTSNNTSTSNIVAKTAVSSVNQSSDKSDVGKEENSAINKD